jgi:hypothetical protein
MIDGVIAVFMESLAEVRPGCSVEYAPGLSALMSVANRFPYDAQRFGGKNML